jgi:hypothetical protein
MTRDTFRETVFARDSYGCVICRRPISDVRIDAHHIMERRLWDDGGYYLDNGATLCDQGDAGCHKKAETTEISCEEIRSAAGITRVLLPPHLYRDNQYDKWGNIILPSGNRIKGELFGDESVQKNLRMGGVIDLFQPYVKYPRTYHLPWSPGLTDDDRAHEHTDFFAGKRVIITEKMDGENTTMYRDYIHARSLDSGSHPSRGWVKNLHAQVCGDIPEGWRICGENLYAKHSLGYSSLPSYFMAFSIWDERNYCLSWDDTRLYAEVLGLEVVPVLYDGLWDEAYVRGLAGRLDLGVVEGYVVRVADAFSYGQFRRCVGKFVRKEHVGTSHNWMMQAITRNSLK